MSRLPARLLAASALALTALSLASCGTTVPQLNEAWEPADINDELVYRIKKSIYCELVSTAREFNQQSYSNRGKQTLRLPNDWGAQMTLTLAADETGALNPSGSYNRNIHPAFDPVVDRNLVSQSLTLPFSTQLSSQAVRTDTYYSFYTVPELVRERYIDTVCGEFNRATNTLEPLDRRGSSYLLSGNVGIRSWMSGALLSNNAIPASELPKSQNSLNVLQYSIKFSVVTSGSFNPMWKLAPVSTGISGFPLVSGNRTRTHTLLLTLGPAGEAAGKPFPAPPAVSLHSTGQIEQAVSSGFRSALESLR